MTDEKYSIDDEFYDFDFGNDLKDEEPKAALTSKELDYIKREVFSKNFIYAMKAEKQKKDDQRLGELEPMITFVKNYYEKIDEFDWYEERFLADALDSYPNGSRKTADIIYQLTRIIQGIAFSACENNHDHKIHSNDITDIKVLASFIVDLTEGRL